MYVSVTIIILGEALLTRSVALAIYWAVWFTGANLFLLGYEEPTLRRRFGPSYDEYSRKVGRWIPKFIALNFVRRHYAKDQSSHPQARSKSDNAKRIRLRC